jgi:creatinine amidohydrolase/Fe(II)-dependent formamide hydrolase-like protein
MAEHHLGFAGTMSLQPATLMAVMHDLVLSLATHGFERIFVVNGHGGNMATTKAAFAQAYGTAASRGTTGRTQTALQTLQLVHGRACDAPSPRALWQSRRSTCHSPAKSP